MFTLEGVRKFHGWTHASLTLLLDHLATIPASDYVKELPQFGISTLRNQTIHILNCEGFWIHTLQKLQYPFATRRAVSASVNYPPRVNWQTF